MTETKREKSFVIPKQESASSQQPLEIYHLSHDLRGPLNSILGFSELLVEGIEGPLTEVQLEDIRAIYQSAQTLLRRIDTVVNLSKIEAGRLVLTFGPVQLDGVVNKVFAFGFENVKLNGTILTNNISNTFPSLLGNRERVEDMVFNLVEFALKVTGVTEVIVTADHDDNEATIQVIAAAGILPSNDIASLFDLAIQVDAQGRNKLGKGGIEMPLVHGLAQAHQGQVWVENKDDTGTIFYLNLPLHKPE